MAFLITVFILAVRLITNAQPSEVGFTTGGLIGTYWLATTTGGLIVVLLSPYLNRWWGAMAIGTLVAFVLYVVILVSADYAGISFFVQAAREGNILGLLGLLLFAAAMSGGGAGLALWWEHYKD